MNKKDVKAIFKSHKLTFPTRVGENTIDADTINFVLNHWNGRFSAYHGHDELVEKLAERIAEIKRYNKEGGIIYRWIFFNDESEIDDQNIGVHWTSNADMIHDENAMHSIVDEEASKKSLVAKVTAHMPSGCVDFDETWDNSESYPEEEEIAIEKSKVSRLKISKVEVSKNPYYGRGI